MFDSKTSQLCRTWTCLRCFRRVWFLPRRGCSGDCRRHECLSLSSSQSSLTVGRATGVPAVRLPGAPVCHDRRQDLHGPRAQVLRPDAVSAVGTPRCYFRADVDRHLARCPVGCGVVRKAQVERCQPSGSPPIGPSSRPRLAGAPGGVARGGRGLRAAVAAARRRGRPCRGRSRRSARRRSCDGHPPRRRPTGPSGRPGSCATAEMRGKVVLEVGFFQVPPPR
jgi:hypothetical protein